MGTTSDPQAVTLSNSGNATLTITSIVASRDFAQTNGCGTSLGAGASCIISTTFKPMAPGPRTGTLTITDNAPGSPHAVALSGTGTDLSLDVSSASSTSATVDAGQTANYLLTLTPTGISGTASMGCSGAPRAATCTVSPSSLTLDGSTPAGVTVTVRTTARSIAPPTAPFGLPGGLGRPATPWLLWLLVLLMFAGFSLVARRRAAWALATAVLMVTLWSACGGDGPPPTPPQTGTLAGTYTLTVTGTASGLSRSIALTLTVR